MADTEKLRAMLDNIIDDKGEQAQIEFHSYLQDKMQEVLGNGQEAGETEEGEAQETNED